MMFPQLSQRRVPRLAAIFILLLVFVSGRAARAAHWLEGARSEATRAEARLPTARCADVQQTIAEAERLRAEWKLSSFQSAVSRYSEAISCWRTAGERVKLNSAQMSVGDIYFTLSDYAQAHTYYAQALKGWQLGGDRQEEAEARYKLSLACAYLGDTTNAVRHAQAALKLSRQLMNKRIEARALDSQSLAAYLGSNLAQALEGFKQALTLAEEAGDRPQQAQVLLNLGYVYNDAGELEESLAAYQQALPLWREAHNLSGLCRTLTAIGGSYSALGENQQALDHHQQALQIATEMGDIFNQAVIHNNLGYVYETLGDYDRALEQYQQALTHYTAAGNLLGQAQTSQFVGNVYTLLGRNEQAQACYARGLALSRQLKDPTLEALALNHIGSAAQAAGQRTEAQTDFTRALVLYRKAGNRRAEAITLNYLGDLLRTMGRNRAARDYLARALPLSRATGDRAVEVLTRNQMARVERDLGQLEAARAQLEATLKIIEALRVKVINLDLRASYLAAVRQHYELYIDVLMQMNRTHPDASLDAVALQVSELARARSLLDMLVEGRADIRRGADPALLAREQALQRALDRLDERQMHLLGGPPTDEQAAALAAEMRGATNEYEQVQMQIRAQNPLYAALTQPQPLRLEEIQQQVLDDQTLLLEYALGDERSYLWVVSRAQMIGYELPARDKIERAARRVYELLRAGQPLPGETTAQRQARMAEAEAQYWTQAAELSEMVLGPAAAQLGDKRLLLVADGALQYIPFAALPLPRAAQPENAAAVETNALPLVVKHEIVTLPSASLLSVMRAGTGQRAPAPKAVAILADPVFEPDDPRVRPNASPPADAPAAAPTPLALDRAIRDLTAIDMAHGIPRLLGSREEAESIMAIAPAGDSLAFTGFAANRTQVMSAELSQYQIIHFATHGLLNSERPEQSSIVLSLVDEQGRPQDGFLRLRDIYNLNLPVELVVLSACDTGLGKEVKGEGLIGLTRGFMYAGASSVMASLWRVDDDATTALMGRFYQGVLKDGQRPAAALKQAQLWMRQQKRWHAPYFWAGFTLQGDYNRNLRINNNAHSVGLKAELAGLLLLCIAVAAFVAIRWTHGRVAPDEGPPCSTVEPTGKMKNG